MYINQIRCFICNHNLSKIKTMYLFDFYFNHKKEYIYLCDNHHHLSNHKYYQKTYKDLNSIKNQVKNNYISDVNKNQTTILYNERLKYQYPRHYHQV